MDRVRRIIRYDCIQRMNLTGRGCTAAVMDSGCMPHPDLQDHLFQFHDFTKNHRVGLYDDCGHGTHIHGILCGDGRYSGGIYQGVAPKCRIVSAKILGPDGAGNSEDMLRAMEWILENRSRWNIRLLNLSVAIYKMKNRQRLAELNEMLEALYDAGILIVTAAGNEGPESGSMSDIGTSTRVLTIGCHDFGYRNKQGRSCEQHSGRGIPGYEYRKPDLVAPGTDICSCAFSYTKQRRVTWSYSRKTGTSMAVPIVTGAAALLCEKYPEMSAYMLKKKVQESTSDLHESPLKQGYGMLNLEKMFYPS